MFYAAALVQAATPTLILRCSPMQHGSANRQQHTAHSAQQPVTITHLLLTHLLLFATLVSLTSESKAMSMMRTRLLPITAYWHRAALVIKSRLSA
jgi:hypothetical protein